MFNHRCRCSGQCLMVSGIMSFGLFGLAVFLVWELAKPKDNKPAKKNIIEYNHEHEAGRKVVERDKSHRSCIPDSNIGYPHIPILSAPICPSKAYQPRIEAKDQIDGTVTYDRAEYDDFEALAKKKGITKEQLAQEYIDELIAEYRYGVKAKVVSVSRGSVKIEYRMESLSQKDNKLLDVAKGKITEKAMFMTHFVDDLDKNDVPHTTKATQRPLLGDPRKKEAGNGQDHDGDSSSSEMSGDSSVDGDDDKHGESGPISDGDGDAAADDGDAEKSGGDGGDDGGDGGGKKVSRDKIAAGGNDRSPDLGPLPGADSAVIDNGEGAAAAAAGAKSKREAKAAAAVEATSTKEADDAEAVAENARKNAKEAPANAAAAKTKEDKEKTAAAVAEADKKAQDATFYAAAKKEKQRKVAPAAAKTNEEAKNEEKAEKERRKKEEKAEKERRKKEEKAEKERRKKEENVEKERRKNEERDEKARRKITVPGKIEPDITFAAFEEFAEINYKGRLPWLTSAATRNKELAHEYMTKLLGDTGITISIKNVNNKGGKVEIRYSLKLASGTRSVWLNDSEKDELTHLIMEGLRPMINERVTEKNEILPKIKKSYDELIGEIQKAKSADDWNQIRTQRKIFTPDLEKYNELSAKFKAVFPREVRWDNFDNAEIDAQILIKAEEMTKECFTAKRFNLVGESAIEKEMDTGVCGMIYGFIHNLMETFTDGRELLVDDSDSHRLIFVDDDMAEERWKNEHALFKEIVAYMKAKNNGEVITAAINGHEAKINALVQKALNDGPYGESG